MVPEMVDLNSLPLPDLFDEITADGSLEALVMAAVREELGEIGDVTTVSIIGDGWTVRAEGVARQAGVVAGLAAIPRILDTFECRPAAFEPQITDGRPCTAGQTLWRLVAELPGVLAAERTMLNIVGRLSGIATLTRRYVERVAGTKAVICDTRKTTPGLRSLEKYAVRCGGGIVHRLGLHDAALFKDNHLAHLGPSELTPAITRAAEAARGRYDLRFIEVEADSLEQLKAVLACPADLIDMVLLDNMSPKQLHKAVAIRDAEAPRVQLEASGGIDLDRVRAVAQAGVDRIAVGAITHSAPALDVGLDLA